MSGAPDEGEGTGKTLHEAAEKAWDDAKAKNNPKGWYEIKKIDVKTENPITEYRVKIKKI
jgi:hypothetical protein